jgi:hypothetical protein
MSTPQPHEQEQPQFAPLDAEITFTVQAEILGIRGPLEIRAQRVSSIQRVLRLLKQNHVLAEQPIPSTSDEPPNCTVHNRPMKPSKKPGAWYCSARVGEGYCDQKVR